MKITKKLKKGFSITESVVSLALIVLVALIGLTSITISTQVQNKSFLNLDIYNSSENFLNSFSKAYIDNGKSVDDLEKDKFMKDFNNNLLFYFGLDFLIEPELENSIVSNYISVYEYQNDMYKTYAYDYKYVSNLFYINANINIRTGKYYLSIDGFKKDDKLPSYSYSGDF